MLLYTSIPPRFSRKSQDGEENGAEYLSACVNSWRENGFEPISINRPDEVKAIAELGLLEVRAASMAEAIWPNRYGPSLGCLFDALPRDDKIAIINADIFMLRSNLSGLLRKADDRTIVAARRSDVGHLGAPVCETFELGFDLFCFNPADVPKVVSNPSVRRFQMGVPWWDYVFPLSCMSTISLQVLREPTIAHQLHADRWDVASWKELGIEAARTLAEYFPEVFRPILDKMSDHAYPERQIAMAFQARLFEGPTVLDVQAHPCAYFNSVPVTTKTSRISKVSRMKKRSWARRAVHNFRDQLRVVRRRGKLFQIVGRP